MRHLKTGFKSIAGGALIALIGTCAWRPACAGQEFEVRTVSSRPDAVNGGDVLVQVTAPSDSNWTALSVACSAAGDPNESRTCAMRTRSQQQLNLVLLGSHWIYLSAGVDLSEIDFVRS